MEELHLGTVTSFKKQRGFGHIKPDDESELGAKVSCHWKSIKSTDKWPTLVDGMRVAFQVESDGKGGWKTTEVYNEDGDEITLPDERIFLKKGKKYIGSCKSYDKSKGTGLILPNGKGPWPKTGITVLRSDINSDGGTPFLKNGQRIQFQVYKAKDGYGAANVTLPGGKDIPTGGQSGSKKVEKPVVGKKSTKVTGKRKLSQVSGNKIAPTKKSKVIKKTAKKSNSGKKTVKGTGSPLKRAQIPGGMHGGMELSEEDIIEVGLILRKNWVGALIGKKGVTINEIKKWSNANINFGDDEINIGGGLFSVVALSGTMNQVAEACKSIAVKLGESSQTLELKIVFLVPEQWCGMFVGKKGSTINEIRGDVDQRVWVDLGKDPVQLPGSNRATLCTVHGPRENVKEAIERSVAILGAISCMMKNQSAMMTQWGDNGWSTGQGRNQRGGNWGSNQSRGNWGSKGSRNARGSKKGWNSTAVRQR